MRISKVPYILWDKDFRKPDCSGESIFFIPQNIWNPTYKLFRKPCFSEKPDFSDVRKLSLTYLVDCQIYFFTQERTDLTTFQKLSNFKCERTFLTNHSVVCQINFFTSDPKNCKVQAEISLRTLRNLCVLCVKKNVKKFI